VPKRSITLADVGLILAVGGLFGMTFVLIKVALTSITPFTIAFLRLFLAALPLLVILRRQGLRLPPLGPIWGSFTVMGLGNGALAYVLINWSSQHLEAGLVGILIATTPLFTLVLSYLFTPDERLRPAGVLAVLLGLGGVIWLIGPDALRGLGWRGPRLWGEVAMLGAALCYAVAAVHGRVLAGVPPMVTATAQQITGALAMAPIVLLWETPWALTPRWQDLLAVAVGAVFGTSLAYLLFFRLLARAGANRTVLITYITPVSALLLGALFLGERLPLRAFGAMALIFLSIALAAGFVDHLLTRRVRKAAADAAGAAPDAPTE
jgi:drug/metabolite transporter (DMT)-like permease